MAHSNSSHSPRSPHTLRRQLALKELLRVQHDLERGERIRQLREDSHMTQPAIAERVGVTLRAYQKWEEGGGLAWENLEALAKVHHSSAEYIARGETPDLFSKLNGDMPENELRAQLDRIEDLLRAVVTRLGVEASLPPEARPANTQATATKATAASNTRAPRSPRAKP